MDIWDRYANSHPHRRETNAKGEKTWFNWTQYPDHGPGMELLALNSSSYVLDLGCGKGGNLAHIAANGHRAVGVDISPVQIAKANERYSDLELHCVDARSYLNSGTDKYDAIYSVFGPVCITDPELLLPAVQKRLCGVFAFSYAPSVQPCWDIPLEDWICRMKSCGFTDVDTQQVAAPRDCPQWMARLEAVPRVELEYLPVLQTGRSAGNVRTAVCVRGRS